MALSHSSAFTSEIFELIAQDGQKFAVHGAILAAQSEPLRRATTGPWTESQERRIDLQEWDSETVDRLVCFLYRGDYQSPDTKPFSPLLLAHAKVYALAHYKDVKNLKTLALHRLKAALVNNNAIEPKAIVGLVRYVYLNTDSLRSGEEPMRRMVLYFVASDRVLESEEIKRLLSEEGGLSREFVIEVKFYEQMVKKENAQVSLEVVRNESLALGEKVRSLDQERAMEKALRESLQASFKSSQQEVATLKEKVRLLDQERAMEKASRESFQASPRSSQQEVATPKEKVRLFRSLGIAGNKIEA